jgi:hypothetical protein
MRARESRAWDRHRARNRDALWRRRRTVTASQHCTHPAMKATMNRRTPWTELKGRAWSFPSDRLFCPAATPMVMTPFLSGCTLSGTLFRETRPQYPHRRLTKRKSSTHDLCVAILQTHGSQFVPPPLSWVLQSCTNFILNQSARPAA